MADSATVHVFKYHSDHNKKGVLVWFTGVWMPETRIIFSLSDILSPLQNKPCPGAIKTLSGFRAPQMPGSYRHNDRQERAQCPLWKEIQVNSEL